MNGCGGLTMALVMLGECLDLILMESFRLEKNP